MTTEPYDKEEFIRLFGKAEDYPEVIPQKPKNSFIEFCKVFYLLFIHPIIILFLWCVTALLTISLAEDVVRWHEKTKKGGR